jgi:phosphoenolpyruvate carboxykinase (GTP)
MSSEKTAAAAGTVGEVRFDPFAMLPFCGYNMADYFAHWLRVGSSADRTQLPKLFWVNWFRKSPEGKFLWPGYGENSRVVKWVLERIAGEGEAVDTPIGRVPTVDAIDTSGLDIERNTLEQLVQVDSDSWRQEIPLIEAHYAKLGERLPQELKDQLASLEKRLAQ